MSPKTHTGGTGTNQYVRHGTSRPVPPSTNGLLQQAGRTAHGIGWASTLDSATQTAVTLDPHTPITIATRLATQLPDREREHTAYNTQRPQLLQQFAQDPNPQIRAAVAANRNTPQTTLTELARDPQPQVRQAVANNRNTPETTLAELARDPDPRTQHLTATNRTINLATVRHLAQHSPPDTQLTLIRYQPPSKLNGKPARQLATHPDPQIRTALASNTTDIPALTQLAHDPQTETRQATTQNPNTPPELLDHLSRDPNKDIRRQTARHKNCPPTTLRWLARDPDPNIQNTALAHPHCPTATLTAHANDPNPRTRSTIASNPNTSRQTLTQLAQDTDPQVLYSLTRNPKITPTMLQQITETIHLTETPITLNPNYHTALAIIEHPNTPDQLTQQILGATTGQTRANFVYRAHHLPATLISKLAKDRSNNVRQAIATRKDTPDTILQQLTQDRNHTVQNAATTNLQHRQTAQTPPQPPPDN
jgi:hypothetical protein